MTPDSRRRMPHGKHPDIAGHTSHRVAMLHRQGLWAEMRDLEQIARGTAENDAKPRKPMTPDDAAKTLGLDAERMRMASRGIAQVAADARDMLDVATKAIDAGIPRYAVQYMLQCGMELYDYNRRMIAKAAAMPDGTTRMWGSRQVVKRGGKWLDAATGQPATQTPPPSPHAKAKQVSGAPGSPVKAPTAPGQPPGPPKVAQAASGATGVPGLTSTAVDPHVRARFLDIRQRARKVGMRIKGALHPSHTAAHMDALERKVSQHEGAAQAVADAKKEPSPAQLHGQLAEADQQVATVKAEELQGLAAKLLEQSAALRAQEKPEKRAVAQHRDHVQALLTLAGVVAGGAIAAATGADITGAALAGGVQGYTSKVQREIEAIDKQGQHALFDDKGKDSDQHALPFVTPKPDSDQHALPFVTKAYTLWIDPVTGWPLLAKGDRPPTGGGWHPIPGGKRGGLRRRIGRGWEYWYPGDVNPQASYGRHRALDKEQLEHVLAHGKYSVVSAGRNPNDPEEAKLPEDHPKFVERHEQLVRDIRRAGLHYTDAEGHYGGKEHSLIVFHGDKARKHARKGIDALMVHHGEVERSPFAVVRAIASQHNQDSVVHSAAGKHELHYTVGDRKGKHVKGEGVDWKDDAQDLYSDVSTVHGDHSRFALQFDWGKEHSMDNAVLKSGTIRG